MIFAAIIFDLALNMVKLITQYCDLMQLYINNLDLPDKLLEKMQRFFARVSDPHVIVTASENLFIFLQNIKLYEQKKN
jgi:hypothetical protein